MTPPDACPPLYRRLRKLLAPNLSPVVAEEMERLFLDIYREAGDSRVRRARVWILGILDLVGHRFGGWGERPGGESRDGGERTRELLSAVWADVRYASRGLRRRPVLSATVVVTLALGVGANTAIFSVVRSALYGPLSFTDVGSLVQLGESDDLGRSFVATSMPNYMEWKTARAFEGMEGYWAGRSVWLEGRFPERVVVSRVTDGYFRLVGLRPMLGRTFTPEEHLAEARVAILTHSFWLRALGADSTVVGRDVELDSGPMRVVGVMGPDVGPTGVAPFNGELIVPMATIEKPVWTRRARFLHVVARLRTGVALNEARTEMAAIGQNLRNRFPADNPRSGIRVLPIADAIVGAARTPLLLLWGAVGLVLLITCLNIATLLLVRALERSGEFTLRRAVGASRSRLVRLAFTETVVLACFAGAVGVGVARFALDVFLGFVPADIPRMDEVRLDGMALAFTAALSLLSTVLVGLAPALTASRAARASRPVRGGAERTSTLLRAAVVAEVATALVLVFGSSVFVESLRSLAAIDPGYDVAGGLSGQVTLPASRYPGPPERIAFYRQLEDRVRAIPGVQAAGVAALPVPATGGFAVGLGVDGGVDDFRGSLFQVGPGFFTAHDIRRVSGRAFTTGDGPGSAAVVVLSESAAQMLFGDGPVLGHTLRITTHLSLTDEPREVVGVVRDARLFGPESPLPTAVYMPLDQWASGSMYVTARTATDPGSMSAALRSAIHEVDPTLPVTDVATLEERLVGRRAAPRFYSSLMGTFAGLALLLTAAGVFGTLSTSVEQRIREISVRVALGAHRVDVLVWAVRIGMTPTLIGVAIGTAALWGLGAVLGPSVPELEAADPLVVSFALGLVLLVTLATSLLAARRATGVDPISVLRAET